MSTQPIASKKNFLSAKLLNGLLFPSHDLTIHITQIIPIVDLTESAEGSILRQDLQTSLSLTSVTAFSVSNTTTTLVNTTGYNIEW